MIGYYKGPRRDLPARVAKRFPSLDNLKEIGGKAQAIRCSQTRSAWAAFKKSHLTWTFEVINITISGLDYIIIKRIA